MQFDMFGNQEKQVILNQDGLATFYPEFFSENYFDKLNAAINWKQDEITLYGKTHNIPRLQAWYGDDGVSYSYSGVELKTEKWIPELLEIKKFIEGELGLEFNSCLCNLYRDGSDYASWHSDDEPELGNDPVIASVSFGQERKIVFKHRTDKSIEKIEQNLTSKSLLIMEGRIQHFWKHQLNKTAKRVDQRINLTFRLVK